MNSKGDSVKAHQGMLHSVQKRKRSQAEDASSVASDGQQGDTMHHSLQTRHGRFLRRIGRGGNGDQHRSLPSLSPESKHTAANGQPRVKRRRRVLATDPGSPASISDHPASSVEAAGPGTMSATRFKGFKSAASNGDNGQSSVSSGSTAGKESSSVMSPTASPQPHRRRSLRQSVTELAKQVFQAVSPNSKGSPLVTSSANGSPISSVKRHQSRLRRRSSFYDSYISPFVKMFARQADGAGVGDADEVTFRRSSEVSEELETEAILQQTTQWIDEETKVFFKNLPSPPSPGPPLIPGDLPQLNGHPAYTLVLDLDETLVHSTLEPIAEFDHQLKISSNGTNFDIRVKFRPFVHEFLHRVCELFEVVIFTASMKDYAEPLVDFLDKSNKIRHRFFREHCQNVDGIYVKNLDVLGRDMNTTMLVDNSPRAFGYHLANGVPIESWFDDPNDHELQSVLQFLEDVIRTRPEDVRPVIEQRYGLRREVHGN